MHQTAAMGPSVPFIIGLILAHLHILYTIKQQKSLPPDTFSGGGEEKEKGWEGRGGEKKGMGRKGRTERGRGDREGEEGKEWDPHFLGQVYAPDA